LDSAHKYCSVQFASQKHSNHTTILFNIKVATANASTNSKAASKGRRYVPPAATGVKWSTADFDVFQKIAAGKLGVSVSKLGKNHAEVINIAMNCYGAKDLAFILSRIGYDQLPFPTGKKLLVSTITELLRDDARLGAFTASTEPVAVSATAKSTKAASSGASLVSISPGLELR